MTMPDELQALLQYARQNLADTRLLTVVGEKCAAAGAPEAAVEMFAAAATASLGERAPLKAVGYLRRALEVDPWSLRLREQLAELYASLRLLPEARDEYRRALDTFAQQRRASDAVRVLSRLQQLGELAPGADTVH